LAMTSLSYSQLTLDATPKPVLLDVHVECGERSKLNI